MLPRAPAASRDRLSRKRQFTGRGDSLRSQIRKLSALGLLFLCTHTVVHAETGAEGWLRYARLDQQAAQKYDAMPASVIKLGSSAVLETAQQELIRGIRGMLGGTLPIEEAEAHENAILLGTLSDLRAAVPGLSAPN